MLLIWIPKRWWPQKKHHMQRKLFCKYAVAVKWVEAPEPDGSVQLAWKLGAENASEPVMICGKWLGVKEVDGGL